MAESVDMKSVVQHLANGTLDKLCFICLKPIEEDNFESIFTLICKEETEYCVADAIEAVCQFQFEGTENHNICIDCFVSASEAYKFHLQAKQSMEIITYYTEELSNNVKNVDITDEDIEKLLCIPLSEFVPATCLFDFSLDGIGKKHVENHDESNMTVHKEEYEIGLKEDESPNFDSESDVVEKDKKSSLDYSSDGMLNLVNSESDEDEEMVMIINEKKIRKKRDPMVDITCSRCPTKYRFVTTLKKHMKVKHDVDIYYCKICKILFELKEEYEEHLKTHSGRYHCTMCNAVYKKEDSLIVHIMKSHDTKKDFVQSENANICELCGAILEDEDSLEEHMNSKHVKKYTCYYCGRMYKGERGFESHIRKHEAYFKKKNGTRSEQASSKSSENQENKSKRRFICQTCGKDFVDERALLWHQRLHNNDRPYTCEVCGRGFVTKNRRNQHSLCSHTPPARRCPLCPALFHLRSMVNTHVKKVHLKAHKRRNRRSRQTNVFWRTEPVPIQELSVDVQDDILELKASQTLKMNQATSATEPTTEENSMLFM